LKIIVYTNIIIMPIDQDSREVEDLLHLTEFINDLARHKNLNYYRRSLPDYVSESDDEDEDD
jgi:hypothetical protein